MVSYDTFFLESIQSVQSIQSHNRTIRFFPLGKRKKSTDFSFIRLPKQKSHQNLDASVHENFFLTIKNSESINHQRQRSHQNVDASAHEKFFSNNQQV